MAANRDKWESLFSEWKESGTSRTEFCRKKEIPVSTFDYWRCRIRKETVATQESNIVQIPVKLKQHKKGCFVLRFPSGIKLNIPESFSRDDLRDLVSIIQGL